METVTFNGETVWRCALRRQSESGRQSLNQTILRVFKMKMKLQMFLTAVFLELAASNLPAEQVYSFRYIETDVLKVLEGYQAVVGKKLVIASAVTNLPGVKISVEARLPSLRQAQEHIGAGAP